MSDFPNPNPPAVEAQPTELPPAPTSGTFIAVGRRKTAVARVRVTPGSGKIMINGREHDKYFHEPQELAAVTNPLTITNTAKAFDVHVLVQGGGHSGQSGAILLGISRALLKADTRYEGVLRDRGFLTRDSREVERKKYGRRKARRRFQFSKR
ncbi:MAG: 30S ribosomal protein S9 [Phycisphaerae bacterium]